MTRAEHVRFLVAENVTHVLDCRLSNPHPELYRSVPIVHLQCAAIDDRQPQSEQWFHRGVALVLNALEQPDSRVLVHCMLGASRAPSMTYAILRVLGFSAEDAESRIRTARAMVNRITYQRDADRAVRAWQAGKRPGNPG